MQDVKAKSISESNKDLRCAKNREQDVDKKFEAKCMAMTATSP